MFKREGNKRVSASGLEWGEGRKGKKRRGVSCPRRRKKGVEKDSGGENLDAKKRPRARGEKGSIPLFLSRKEQEEGKQQSELSARPKEKKLKKKQGWEEGKEKEQLLLSQIGRDGGGRKRQSQKSFVTISKKRKEKEPRKGDEKRRGKEKNNPQIYFPCSEAL